MRFARPPRQADPLLSYANGETPPQIPYSVERWRGGRLEGGKNARKKEESGVGLYRLLRGRHIRLVPLKAL